MSARALSLALAASFLCACAGGPRRMAGAGTKLAIRTVVNQTQQFGLEDKLFVSLRDEFLRDARYPVTPEAEAKDVLAVTVTRYLLTPTQYDATLAPSTYKLSILCDVSLLDRVSGKALWDEKDLEGAFTYPASTLAGGMTEPQAQAEIWSILAPMIVARVEDGFSAAAKAGAGPVTR